MEVIIELLIGSPLLIAFGAVCVNWLGDERG